MGVLGCRIRWSSLNEALGIPGSFECTVDARIHSYDDVVRLAGLAAARLSRLLGAEARLGGLAGWEFIGGRFNLYSFRLESRRGGGVLRVVESGGYAVNVSGVLEEGLARRALEPGVIVSEGDNLGITMLREPPEEPAEGAPSGQRYIPKMVVYAAEGVPRIEPRKWSLRVTGAVGRPASYSLESLARGLRGLRGDFHCVTGWSVSGRLWEGVPVRELVEASEPDAGAEWLAAVSAGGYSSVMPLREALKGMVVLRVDGEPLEPEHGFPARLYLPSLYGWKHAKWLVEIRLLRDYEDGYWEALSYHERGLVAYEERFKIRNPVIADAGRLPGKPRRLKPPTG